MALKRRKIMELNQLRDTIHKNAVDHGFYEIDTSMLNKHNVLEKLMLVVSELGEACEAYRKGHYTEKTSLEYPFEKLGEKDFNMMFKLKIKDRFEDEIADSIIRLFDLAGFMNIDIEKHIALKMKYNESRPYKHGKIC
jgi:NTP pyrophosphatase (non-canonical NTP hydrolase)